MPTRTASPDVPASRGGLESKGLVALVHDYVTQRGGAERVVLAMAKAFPDAPLYTSLLHTGTAFPEFETMDVRTGGLDRVSLLRRHHRLAFPMLAPSFGRMIVDADVALCSSSGWAHGARTTGRKVVYCHTPARWLYQTDRYLAGRSRLVAAAVGATTPLLRRWDHRAAHSAHRYLVNSTVVRDRVRLHYGLDAEVLPPPVTFDAQGPLSPVNGVDEGFFLCVSRLLPYKNVAVVMEAFRRMPGRQLVVVGHGPLYEELCATAPRNVRVLGAADDATLRWLYKSSRALVAASYEDFGLTPIEAAAFGKPTVALRWGGFLDTVIHGETGVFFDVLTDIEVAAAIERLAADYWPAERLQRHANRFSADQFQARLRRIVDEELAA